VRHHRPDAYSAEQVLLNKRQIYGMFLNSQKNAAVTGIIVHAVLRNSMSSDGH